MSEALTRHEPVTGTPFVADGVRISLAPPMQRHHGAAAVAFVPAGAEVRTERTGRQRRD